VLYLVSCVVLSKGAKQTNQAKVWFGVLCGFPVKKSISVKTKTSRAVAGCGQFRVRCGCYVQAKAWCCVWVLCGCKVRVYSSKDKMAWFCAVLSAIVGCKVKVLG
jgi:hypothetical protein